MTGSELLSTPDARVWAKEFCEKFGGNTVNGGVVDLELMFGWFANAMEVGRMQVSSATPSPTIAAPSPSNEVTAEKIRVRLFQKVGGWSVICDGHADEHVCLAASILFNAVCAGLTALATIYPDQIEVVEEDATIEAALKARKPEDDGAGR